MKNAIAVAEKPVLSEGQVLPPPQTAAVASGVAIETASAATSSASGHQPTHAGSPAATRSSSSPSTARFYGGAALVTPHRTS